MCGSGDWHRDRLRACYICVRSKGFCHQQSPLCFVVAVTLPTERSSQSQPMWVIEGRPRMVGSVFLGMAAKLRRRQQEAHAFQGSMRTAIKRSDIASAARCATLSNAWPSPEDSRQPGHAFRTARALRLSPCTDCLSTIRWADGLLAKWAMFRESVTGESPWHRRCCALSDISAHAGCRSSKLN